MAVQAQLGGLAGVPAACFPRGSVMVADEVETHMRAMQDYGALLSAVAAANNGYNCAAVVSGAQSELTCNGGGGVLASRKRGREVEQYVSSSSALLPIPGMVKAVVPSPAVDAVAVASRWVESSMTSTSGRPAAAAESSFADALVSELYQHSAETDALVRMECERLRAGLEQARKRQCQALVLATSAAEARRLREKEAELEAARRRAVELEERLRQAAAESQAWFGLARSNEAVAAGLRATLDHLLLRAAGAPSPVEGFGNSSDPAADDAQSCCFEATKDAPKEDVASWSTGRRACKCCGDREASVLLLPCRHLCLCKACEPKVDACPVCLASKKASVVALSPTEAW